MTQVEQKLVPFILGIAIGHWGVRWATHVIYLATIVAVFFVGKHIGHIS